MEQSPDYRFPSAPRIIYMGTPEFAVPALKKLIKKGHNVTAVVTQPDRPRGRGRCVSCCPVKETALEHNLKVLQPENVNDRAFIEKLKSMDPDLFIVAAFGQILDQDVLSIPGYGALNIHASVLPRYRGAAPIQWAILDNERATGVTIMKMTRGLDRGPILYVEKTPIKENETAGQLFDRLAELSGDAIIRFLRESAEKTLVEVPQDDAHATYASKITKEIAEIDWSMDAVKISSLIRALDPVPGAATLMNGKKIKVFSPVVKDRDFVSGRPGRVTVDDDQRFLVEAGRGIIEIGEIQLPGKKRISAGDFLRGNRMEKDTVLGS